MRSTYELQIFWLCRLRCVAVALLWGPHRGFFKLISMAWLLLVMGSRRCVNARVFSFFFLIPTDLQVLKLFTGWKWDQFRTNTDSLIAPSDPHKMLRYVIFHALVPPTNHARPIASPNLAEVPMSMCNIKSKCRQRISLQILAEVSSVQEIWLLEAVLSPCLDIY